MRKLLLFIALAFCISTNAQITWNMGMNISTNANGNMHPRITLDRLGNPLVIWGKMSDESVYFSKWNGTMFTTPSKIKSCVDDHCNSQLAKCPHIASLWRHGIRSSKTNTRNKSDTNRLFIFTSFKRW
jgi:hypothetical protein